jgi:hypothetical protein
MPGDTIVKAAHREKALRCGVQTSLQYGKSWFWGE